MCRSLPTLAVSRGEAGGWPTLYRGYSRFGVPRSLRLFRKGRVLASPERSHVHPQDVIIAPPPPRRPSVATVDKPTLGSPQATTLSIVTPRIKDYSAPNTYTSVRTQQYQRMFHVEHFSSAASPASIRPHPRPIPPDAPRHGSLHTGRARPGWKFPACRRCETDIFLQCAR
jgi:hypothetical protein